MNCKDVLRVIEDFHYGELDSEAAENIQRHLRSCKECAGALEALYSEDQVYRAYSDELERTLELPQQMWCGVEQRLAAIASQSFWRTVRTRFMDFLLDSLPRTIVPRNALFAAVIVLISIGATFLAVRFYQAHGPQIESRSPIAASEGRTEGESQNSLEAAIRSIQRAEREYNDAIEVLDKIADRRKPSMEPQLVKEIERNLKTIDESIAATRAAYHAHPSDPELAHYMLTAYQKKVELLLDLAS